MPGYSRAESPHLRQRWARHEVRRHRAGAERLDHPLVGELTISYETMELTADDGLSLMVCGVAPGSRDAIVADGEAEVWDGRSAGTRPRAAAPRRRACRER
ncbi:hypothetical protein [Streptomyces sp. NPDC051642]|uniref:MmyB family transcriptional regulator n=1 Tax=unclassified Streptomyces TaxID=2593676 RepID=UPI00344ACD9A